MAGAAAPLPVALHFNCGFCQVSIKELSMTMMNKSVKSWKADSDKELREKKFCEQFVFLDLVQQQKNSPFIVQQEMWRNLEHVW